MLTVYALLDPVTNECRYVGQTSQFPKYRFNQHLARAASKGSKDYPTHKARWIRKLLKQGLEPTLHILTELSDSSQVLECEVYWLDYFKGIGCKMTNSRAAGGGYVSGLSDNRHNSNKTHCKRGHEFSKDNTYIQANPPGRRCRACQRYTDRIRRNSSKES